MSPNGLIRCKESIAGWGGAVEKQFEEQDLVFAETYGPPQQIGMKSRHARSIGDNRPVWHYIKTWKTDTVGTQRAMLEPDNVAALVASVIGSGACPWIVSYCWDILKETPAGAIIKKHTQFFARHRRYYIDAEYPAEMALIGSRATIDHNPDYHIHTGKWYPDVFEGNHDLLAHSHIPFHIIEDWQVEARLNDYRIALLPHPACMSDRLAEQLTCYVHNGGTLIVTETLGDCDERGEKRANPALNHLVDTEPRRSADAAGSICCHRHGKGRFFYLAEDPGRLYAKTNRTEYIAILHDIVNYSACRRAVQVTNCPLTVEVNPAVQKANGQTRYLFHVLNHGEAGSIDGIGIDFQCGRAFKPAQAFVVAPDTRGRKPLRVRLTSRGRAQLTLPVVKTYSLVVVE